MVEIRLCFPHAQRKVEMPGVPRCGDELLWRETSFTVSRVSWAVDPWGEEGNVYVYLEPGEEAAYDLMERERVHDAAKLDLAHAKSLGKTGRIVLVHPGPRVVNCPGADLSVMAGSGRRPAFLTRNQHPEIDEFFDSTYDPNSQKNPYSETIFAFPVGQYQVPDEAESEIFDVLVDDVAMIREAIAERERS
ncbi:hypothetical protein ACIO3O_08575 [Streptomyces sp. NPDC087440]|uniref:hypothetical protein n=1 Tax=Streptomyces sp. NPDC087440 TaxID=3365790 RepID=UPI003808CA21